MNTPTASRVHATFSPTVSEARRVEPGTHRVRPLVFLAEDDDELRRALAEELCKAGFDVLSASSGREMLKLLTAAAQDEVYVPDAFVMDIRMPRTSGIDALAAIRIAGWSQPVVMMTGFGDVSVRERAASHGASVVLDKPFDSDDLVGVLDVLLKVARDEASWRARVDVEPETVRLPNRDRPRP